VVPASRSSQSGGGGRCLNGGEKSKLDGGGRGSNGRQKSQGTFVKGWAPQGGDGLGPGPGETGEGDMPQRCSTVSLVRWERGGVERREELRKLWAGDSTA
jgi:hypothetical protein